MLYHLSRVWPSYAPVQGTKLSLGDFSEFRRRSPLGRTMEGLESGGIGMRGVSGPRKTFAECLGARWSTLCVYRVERGAQRWQDLRICPKHNITRFSLLRSR